MRKQSLPEDCPICGGELFQENDCDDGFFYDGDDVSCAECGVIGHLCCDEDSFYVSYTDEVYNET